MTTPGLTRLKILEERVTALEVGGGGALKVREFTVTDADLSAGSSSEVIVDPAGALPARAIIMGVELTLNTVPTGTPTGVHASYGVVNSNDSLGTTDGIDNPSSGAGWDSSPAGLKAGSAGARGGMSPVTFFNVGMGRIPNVLISVDTATVADIATFSITARLVFYEVDALPVP